VGSHVHWLPRAGPVRILLRRDSNLLHTLSYPLTAVISDIHGNRQALEVCLRDAERRGVQRFVCLGDVVGYGAEPRACLEEIMSRCVAEPTATRQLNPDETVEFDPEALEQLLHEADQEAVADATTELAIQAAEGAVAEEAAAEGDAAEVQETQAEGAIDESAHSPSDESDDELPPGPVPSLEAETLWLEPGFCLLGNHEEALLNSPEDFNPKARAAIEWTKEEIWRDKSRADAYWDFIGDLPEAAADERAMFVHGSPRDPVREYVVPRDIKDVQKMTALFAAMTRGVCFIGHSHVPAVLYEDGSYFVPKGQETAHGPYALGDLAESRAIVNVGSVGQPRDGDPRLSYVLFDGENVTFVRLPYDHASAAESIRKVEALPDFLADRLAAGR